jgi:hypothetical protein
LVLRQSVALHIALLLQYRESRITDIEHV